MPRSLLNSKRVLLMFAALLVVFSVAPMWLAAPVGNAGRGVVLAAVSPIAGMLKSMTAAIRPPAEDRVDHGDEAGLADKYEMAMMLIRKYEAEIVSKDEQIQRLRLSKSALQLEGTEMIDVRVVGYSGDRDNPILTINRGTAGRVGNRMAVIWETNFVGVVDSNRSLTADVRLITAPGSTILARIQPLTPDAAARTAEYFLEVTEDGSAFEVDVPSGTAIAVGDVASVSDSQGHWPNEAIGSFVGKVTDVRPKDSDPLRFDTVTVTPMIELSRLSRVTVLNPVAE